MHVEASSPLGLVYTAVPIHLGKFAQIYPHNIHALFFIRDTKFSILVLSLIFFEILTSSVPYLSLIFSQKFDSPVPYKSLINAAQNQHLEKSHTLFIFQ